MLGPQHHEHYDEIGSARATNTMRSPRPCSGARTCSVDADKSIRGTVLGTVLIQTVVMGLVFTQVDLYLQPPAMAGVIFAAVLLDGAECPARPQRASRRSFRSGSV